MLIVWKTKKKVWPKLTSLSHCFNKKILKNVKVIGNLEISIAFKTTQKYKLQKTVSRKFTFYIWNTTFQT